METWRHVRAIVALPFLVTVVIPTALVCFAGQTQSGWALPVPQSFLPIVVGIGLVCIGLILLVRTITLFATAGQGTLAPWDSPDKLVVLDIYWHVRNPMISGVFCVLLGEAIALRSVAVGGWFLVFLIGNLVYIPLVEERDLERRFGEQYALYKTGVPRWIPRINPWQVPWDEGGMESGLKGDI
jgi:protein-S-isoprenylcysteine O-methyltransferase Ste14